MSDLLWGYWQKSRDTDNCHSFLNGGTVLLISLKYVIIGTKV